MIKTYSIFALVFLALFNMSAAHCEWYVGAGAGVSTYDFPRELRQIFGDLEAATDELNRLPGVDASFDFEDGDTGVMIFAGNHLSETLAVEFGYIDLGETTTDFVMVSDGTSFPPGTTTVSSVISADGFNAGVAGNLPLSDSASLNGRVGVYLWNAEAEFSAVDTTGELSNEGFAESDSGNDIYYGIGLDVGWFGLSYEVYDVDGQDVDFVGISATYQLTDL
jgi:hypothetical protein